MLNKNIRDLVQYGIDTGLVPECERIYTTNLLLDIFHEDEYKEPEGQDVCKDLESILKELLDEAVKRGIIEDSIGYRDLLDTKIMNCLVPRPAQVQDQDRLRFRRDSGKNMRRARRQPLNFSINSARIRTISAATV